MKRRPRIMEISQRVSVSSLIQRCRGRRKRRKRRIRKLPTIRTLASLKGTSKRSSFHFAFTIG